MPFRALVNPFVKSGSLGIQDQQTQQSRAFVWRWTRTLFPGHQFTSLQADFDGPLHPRPIARIQFQRALWIETAQHRVKVFRSATFTQFI